MAEQDVGAALAAIETESGARLLALAEQTPVLLIFLRHFGCPFCRRTIERVSELKEAFEERGVRPVFVHLGTMEIAKAHFDYYGLNDVERVHDPAAALYQHEVFALRRSNPVWDVFRPKVWMGFFKTRTRGPEKLNVQGNTFQMPGMFFLKGPTIVRRFVHKTIADEPDYLQLVG